MNKIFLVVLVAFQLGSATVAHAAAASPPAPLDAAVAQLQQSTGLDRETVVSRLAANSRASAALVEIRARPPSWFAGSWIDEKSLTQIVATTNAAGRADAELLMKAHGYEGEFVHVQATYSMHDLREVRNGVGGFVNRNKVRKRLGRTSLSMNEKMNRLELAVTTRAPSGLVRNVTRIIERRKYPVRVLRSGRLKATPLPKACEAPHCDRPLRAGIAIRFGASAHSNCSAGFFAKSLDNHYLISAGHCAAGEPSQTVYAHSPTGSDYWRSIGPNIASLTNFGPHDYTAIRIDDSSFWHPRVGAGYFQSWNAGYPIGVQLRYGPARDPQQGETVCRFGRTTHWACGPVHASTVDLVVGDVKVDDTFSTLVCADFGDSGGIMVSASDNALLGTLTGGIPECSVPGSDKRGYTVYFKALKTLALTQLNLVQ